jgi:hypothetical protein
MSAEFIKNTTEKDLAGIDVGVNAVRACANDVERLNNALSDGQLQPASLMPMSAALGVAQSRYTRMDVPKMKAILVDWIKSIKEYASEYKTDSPEHYKFPYDKILDATEVNNQLRCRCKTPYLGPTPDPTKKAEKVAVLQFLDANPDLVRPPDTPNINANEASNENELSELQRAVIHGAVCSFESILETSGGD